MSTVGGWLVGMAAFPAEGLIWSIGGGPASLALAGLLLLSAAGLALELECAKPEATQAPKRPSADCDDRRLANAA